MIETDATRFFPTYKWSQIFYFFIFWFQQNRNLEEKQLDFV